MHTKEAEDSFAGGWLLKGAGGRIRRRLEPGRYQKDAGEGGIGSGRKTLGQ